MLFHLPNVTRRIVPASLALLLVLSNAVQPVSATTVSEQYAEVVAEESEAEIETFASGKCGSKARWSFSGDTLTIKGSGATEKYGSNPPWGDFTDSIKKVEVKNGITSIQESTFSGLYKVTSITLPNSLKSILPYAFQYCERLTSITIPKNVNKISPYAFARSGLSSITVSSSNPNYSSKDGVLFNKAQTKLLYYPEQKSITTYSIPKTVTTIVTGAFSDNKSFSYREQPQQVILPASVTTIQKNAFSYSSVTEVRFCGNPPEIAKNAFQGYSGQVYYPTSNSSWKKQSFDLESTHCDETWETWSPAPKPTALTLTRQNKKKVSASWSCDEQPTGYILQYSSNKKMSNSKTLNVTQPKATFSFNGKKCYARVQSYRKADGVTYYSAWSAVTAL